MTIPSWITDSGMLATIPENDFYEYQLAATGDNVEYTLQAGQLPPGLRVTIDGSIQGTPINIKSISIYTFVIRVYDSENINDIYDRTFSLTVEPTTAPFFITTDNYIVTEFSGVKVLYQIKYSDSDLSLPLTIKMTAGSLPNGLKLSNDGIISGIMTLLTAYTETGSDYNYKDFPFTVSINDGTTTVSRSYTIRAKEPPANLPPIIIQDIGTIGSYRYQNYFEYKFYGFDVFNQTLQWSLVTLSGSIDYDNGPYDAEYYDSQAYDSFPFDIDPVSGTLYGLIPTFIEEQKTYTFIVRLTKPNVHQDPMDDESPLVVTQQVYEVTFIGSNDKDLTWVTPTELGSLNYGDNSHYIIETSNPSNLEIAYEYVSGHIPNGLTLLPSGIISGRVEFGGFILDKKTTTIDNELTTFDQTNRFKIRAFSINNFITSTKSETTYVNQQFTANGTDTTFTLNAPTNIDNISVYLNSVLQVPENLKNHQRVSTVTVNDGGDGFTDGTTTITFSQPTLLGGSAATGRVVVISGSISEIIITKPGFGYNEIPTYTIHDSSNSTPTLPSLTIVMGTDINGDYQLHVNNVMFFTTPSIGDIISIHIPTMVTTISHTYLIDEIKEFTININNPYSQEFVNIYCDGMIKLSDRNKLKAILNDVKIFPTDSLYNINDANYGIPKKLSFLLLAGLELGFAEDFLTATSHNFYKKEVVLGYPRYTIAYDPQSLEPVYETIYLPIVDDLENNNGNSVPHRIDLDATIQNALTIDNMFIHSDEITIDSSETQLSSAWPNSYKNMQSNITDTFAYVTETSFSAFPLWMKPLYPNLLVNNSNPREIYKRSIPIAFVKPGHAKKIIFNLTKKKIDFKRFSFEIIALRIDNNKGTSFDVNETIFNGLTVTEFDNHISELTESEMLYGNPYVLDSSSPLRTSFTTFDNLGTRFINEDITFDRRTDHQKYIRFNNRTVLD